MSIITAPISLVFPVRTLHGDSSLADDWLTVRASVMDLLRVVEAAAPNGRDYYPQGPDAFRIAVEERAAISACLSALAEQLYAVAERLIDGFESGDTAKLDAAFSAFEAVPTTAVVRPTIHINGTSRDSLKASCVAVFRQALETEEVFRAIVPNGRDYQPDQMQAARAQHQARVDFVRKVGGYFVKLASTKA